MKISKMLLLSALIGFSAVSCTSTQNGRRTVNDSSAGSGKLELYTIYFDFNRSDIRGDQQTNASAMAHSINTYLQSYPNSKFQIQGNTDDRGSVEYNMALGTRRANSLKDYLVTSGVNSDNLDTVSYGKERPAVLGTDEVAWSQNRRDDVVLLGE